MGPALSISFALDLEVWKCSKNDPATQVIQVISGMNSSSGGGGGTGGGGGGSTSGGGGSTSQVH